MKHVAGLSALMITLATAAAWGQHYVSADGSNEYPYHTLETAAHRIEDAIQAGLDEYYATFVWVAEGRYKENIVVPLWSKVRALVPGSCVITPEVAGLEVAVVTVEYGAEFSGFIVDAAGCFWGIVCNGGTAHECTVFGADRGITAHGGFVEGCAFVHNGAGMYVSGATVVYDTVVAGNLTGIYGIGDTGYSFLVHCTVSGNGGGVCNLDTMQVSMRDCIVWGNSGADGAWEPSFSDITVPGYIGINGNISADPLFVGWGEFNDSDNPIYVDCSSSAEEDGTKEHPFRMIGAALRKYDFHLAVGSPCLGAGSDGLNIGAFPYETPVRSPGPPSVRIQVAPGGYDEGGLLLVQGEHLKGPGPGLATLAPRRHLGAASLGGTSAIEGFFILADQASALSAVGPGTTVADCVITTRGFAPWTPSDWGISSDGARVFNCIIYGMRHAVWGSADILNCTITQNAEEALIFEPEAPPTIRNSVLWANGTSTLTLPHENVSYTLVSDPNAAGINGNILADPRFANAEEGDFRLLPDSPCIDAGFNSPDLPEFDIAGMHRIMFGGKSLTVDMGAYEFYINNLEPIPGTNEAVFTWSSLEGKTYSIFYTDDLFNWHTAIDNFPSSGNQTTSWTDDGTLTGIPPLLAPKRFYRLLENP